jgi:hypothetical protein
MRKSFGSMAIIALCLFSCKKEKSFDPNNPNGGGGGTSDSGLLDRIDTKLGTDSIGILYQYDNQKRFIGYKTGGVVFGNAIEVELKLVRNTQGIIQKIILKNSEFSSMGVDSMVRVVHYDASKLRYSSMAAAYFDGSDDVKDSTAFSYNNAGKLVQAEYFFDDGSGSGYEKEEKVEYTYDANGNVTKEKSYVFDPFLNVYEQSSQYEYEYDNKVNPLIAGNEGLVIGDINIVSTHNITKNTYTDFVDPDLNDASTGTYTYNSINKPITLTQTSAAFPIPVVSKYYYK